MTVRFNYGCSVLLVTLMESFLKKNTDLIKFQVEMS